MLGLILCQNPHKKPHATVPLIHLTKGGHINASNRSINKSIIYTYYTYRSLNSVSNYLFDKSIHLAVVNWAKPIFSGLIDINLKKTIAQKHLSISNIVKRLTKNRKITTKTNFEGPGFAQQQT